MKRKSIFQVSLSGRFHLIREGEKLETKKHRRNDDRQRCEQSCSHERLRKERLIEAAFKNIIYNYPRRNGYNKKTYPCVDESAMFQRDVFVVLRLSYVFLAARFARLRRTRSARLFGGSLRSTSRFARLWRTRFARLFGGLVSLYFLEVPPCQFDKERWFGL